MGPSHPNHTGILGFSQLFVSWVVWMEKGCVITWAVSVCGTGLCWNFPYTCDSKMQFGIEGFISLLYFPKLKDRNNNFISFC